MRKHIIVNLKRKALEILKDKHPIRRLSGAVVGRTGLGRLLKIKINIQGDKYIFNPTALCSLYWYDSTSRNEDHEFISSFLKQDDVYLDVGANMGVTVIPAARSVGNKGRVIAFEPHPKISTYLKENVALNKLNNVDIHNCAVGNQNGFIYFTNKFTDDMNQVSTSSANNIKVPIVLLDDVVKDCSNIALMKLDVEGYEKFVIEGAKETLKKVDCIYFEVSDKNFEDFGYTSRDVFALLEECGFKLFKRERDSKQLLPVDSQYKASYEMYENIFGVKNTADFQKRTQWKV
ncbi:MAG: FkbM family methyltransferase [Ferruginibacter sp.]